MRLNPIRCGVYLPACSAKTIVESGTCVPLFQHQKISNFQGGYLC
ncbi:hypothetical protein RUMCAL_02952 [Ruminococcus callidus ATCC 27760]|uniref:Uncharacterized protein n=1 Tax=Ruminococcus callidus ATCC 27760 TaxID=411473 RepID=U2LIQ4_9FIRM|nr:hypothetical protein RUMCAL_02952 [Ruminococcus callidus ATCC 27760]